MTDIFGWRYGLASLILNWCLVLTLLLMWWVNLLWKIRGPWIRLLRIRCWMKKTLLDLQNISLKILCIPNAWRPTFAARHSYGTAKHSTRNSMGWERHRLTVNAGMSTADWFSILKIYRIYHTIVFISQFLYLACKFEDSMSIFDQFSPRNCVECWALKSLQFFHFTEALLTSFTKIPILLQLLFMKKLLILSTSFVSLMSTTNFFFFATRSFHTIFEYFFNRNRPGIRFFESLLDSQRELALFMSLSRRVLICSLSKFCLRVSWALETCEPSEQTTGLSVLSRLTDDDRQDDRPSSSEWSARLRRASRSVLPMVTSSLSKSSGNRCSPVDSWVYST